MFDLINGLPVHALVVHAVVVLLPLLSVVTVLFVIRPKWRSELPWAILGNALAFLASFVAKESGEKLQARLSGVTGSEVAAHHAALGRDLQYFAFAQLVASIIAWWLVRRATTGASTTGASTTGAAGSDRALAGSEAVARPLLAGAIALTLVAGVAATVWTYRVGDSGAKAVWSDTIANTKAP